MWGNVGAINSAAWCKCLDSSTVYLRENTAAESRVCFQPVRGELRRRCVPVRSQSVTVPGPCRVDVDPSGQCADAALHAWDRYVENKVTSYLFIYSHAYLFWFIHLSCRVTPSRSVKVTTSVSGAPNLTAGPSASSFPSVGVCVCVFVLIVAIATPQSDSVRPSVLLVAVIVEVTLDDAARCFQMKVKVRSFCPPAASETLSASVEFAANYH